jgi:hypothetical protein
LKTEKDHNRQKAENQKGAHIAATAAPAAATRRLNIWILKFGQGNCPVVKRAANYGPPLVLW